MYMVFTKGNNFLKMSIPLNNNEDIKTKPAKRLTYLGLNFDPKVN